MMEFNCLVNNIWIDIDGVAADFDKLAESILGMPSEEFEKTYGSDIFWNKLGEYPNFYRHLELIPDFDHLYNAISYLYNPIFLTGSPFQLGEQARVDKVRWVDEKFNKEQRVVVCQSKLKYMYCVPGDILIDDRTKYKNKWEEAGGVFIHHLNSVNTLRELKNLGLLDGYNLELLRWN